jgi:hypothetical protein
LPLQEDIIQSVIIRVLRDRMDEDIGNPCVKYPAGDAVFFEDEQRQPKPEEDASFQVIPWRGKRYGRSTMLLVPGAGL